MAEGLATAPATIAPWEFQTAQQSRDYIAQYGTKPLTRDLPEGYEVPQEAFITPDRRTPAGQRYGMGDARRGGRLLGAISCLLCAFGIAGEIGSMLVAVSGAEQARRLDWPLAANPPVWRACEFLPNSDAPSTKYGAGLSIFFHAINVLIFAGMLSFLVRFVREPRADYGIAASGLIMITLGLGLASRWIGSLQMLSGVFLIVFGAFNTIFGWHYLYNAFKVAFTSVETVTEDKDNAEALAKEKYERAKDKIRRDKRNKVFRGSADLIGKQLAAYHQYHDTART